MQTLGVGETQTQSVILDKEGILKEWKTGQSSTRKYSKVRKTPYEQLNKLVWEWFCIARSKGVPVSGALLQQKALMFSMQFGHNDFMASNGWLESFKLRHNIQSATLSGEASDISATLEADWKRHLETILEGHELKDVFNADETGVFYQDLPNKSFMVRGETCYGGKKSKQCLTLLVACSATGEKLKPFVVGHSQNPQCFKGKDVNSTNMYRANKEAWMTSDLFCEWLDAVNRKMQSANCHILLLIDNCSAHPDVERSNIKLVFLPPNTMAKLRPYDAGIIQAIKLQYRKRLLRRITFAIEDIENAMGLAKSHLV